ncbi:DMT family transporter [Sinirhodobacter sp. HNIBRBA609]|nr:DMT family transporter [Sinirhodobacter sp. HNIBRBA609]
MKRETSQIIEGGPVAAPSVIPVNRPGLGIALLIGALGFFTLMDAAAKHLGTGYHPAQVVWARFVVNAALLALIFRARLPRLIRARQPGLQLARALMQLATVILFFWAIRHIGLAEAAALTDLNPVLITLGAALFLGEKLGPRRLLGIAVSFVGAMIIIRPGAGVFEPAALLALAAAFTYAGGALLTRAVRFDSTATSLIWSALAGSIVTSLALPFVWTPIEVQDIWAFVACGALGTVGQALLIRAFSMAEAGTLAPFGYLGLIFSSIWGWLFFDQLPDRWTISGALVIVAAGLYVWAREHRAAAKSEPIQ